MIYIVSCVLSLKQCILNISSVQQLPKQFYFLILYIYYELRGISADSLSVPQHKLRNQYQVSQMVIDAKVIANIYKNLIM